MLGGEAGPGVQQAMEIVVALGQIYGAADLVPVASVQVAGVSYKNLGEAGLQFLQAWASQEGRARVPATLNPAGMDLQAWRALGIPPDFAHRQQAVVDAYAALGIIPTCTCTPYLVGHVPHFGQHIAWAESSAVSYANSVHGARTNREGGPSALAAAITGRTARYGLHLDEGRRATAQVEVRCPITSTADLGALGYLVGCQVQDGVPFFHFRQPLPAATDLRTLGAAMAASGAVALYHVEGLTPEAKDGTILPATARRLVIDDLAPGYAALNDAPTEVDLVSLGCPHASLSEIEEIATYLDARQVQATLWITTARATRDAAARAGLVERIEAAGGRVVADTCLVVAPVADLGYHTLATNSAKMAYYAPSHSGLAVRFGTTEQCLQAAITGTWPAAGGQAPHRSAETAVSAQAAAAPGRFPRPQAPGPSTEGSRELAGRAIKPGVAEGIALVSPEPLGFLGGVDPETGIVIEPGHALQGACVAGRVLVFPTGKGSTVGAYTLFRMAQAGTAPAAILNATSEAIVAVGAIISGIPMVDQVEIQRIRTGDRVRVAGNRVSVAP
jgi:predicted aconitase/predicted aconitase with swiveling domain